MSRHRQHPTAHDAIVAARAAAEEARATGTNIVAAFTHYEKAVERLADEVELLDRYVSTFQSKLDALCAAQTARRTFLSTRPLRRLIATWLTGEPHEAEATEDPRPEGEGPTDRHVW